MRLSLHQPALGIAIAVAALAIGRQHILPADEIRAVPAGDEEILASIYTPGRPAAEARAEPIRLTPGAHLLLDDYLIEASQGIVRRVNQPSRDPAVGNPIVTGGDGDGCIGPYLTVVRDPANGTFRIWYNVLSQGQSGGFGTMASDDGIHWKRPFELLADPGPLQWGCSVVDRGPDESPPQQRYKLVWWANGGMMLAVSPDGRQWKLASSEPILRHTHDINSLYYDPLHSRYLATLSVYTTGPTWKGQRRVTLQSASNDLRNWEKPWYVLTPDDQQDEGDTQFYAMDGYLARGDLLVGMVKMLRDDLRASDTPEGSYGIGYTALAWSRDGRHWIRDRQPFFQPDPLSGAWDHAHAWIDDQVPVNDEVFLYYGGYKNGHKVNRYVERQIGLVKMRRDRYVARGADASGGVLRTPLLVIDGQRITLNAQVNGALVARLLDANGQVLPGFDSTDCRPIRGDSLGHELRWNGEFGRLKSQPIRLELELRDAELFALNVEAR